MAVTVESSTTQAATVGTEHVLHVATAAKVYVLLVDTVNLADGDTLELRVKTKVITPGPVGVAYLGTYAHAQEEPIKLSVPIAAPLGAEFTLKQRDGTGRSFDWAVVSVG